MALLGACVESWALHGHRRDATFSHFTRMVYRVHTPSGRKVFTVTTVAASTWWIRHILKEQPDDQP